MLLPTSPDEQLGNRTFSSFLVKNCCLHCFISSIAHSTIQHLQKILPVVSYKQSAFHIGFQWSIFFFNSKIIVCVIVMLPLVAILFFVVDVVGNWMLLMIYNHNKCFFRKLSGRLLSQSLLSVLIFLCFTEVRDLKGIFPCVKLCCCSMERSLTNWLCRQRHTVVCTNLFRCFFLQNLKILFLFMV